MIFFGNFTSSRESHLFLGMKMTKNSVVSILSKLKNKKITMIYNRKWIGLYGRIFDMKFGSFFVKLTKSCVLSVFSKHKRAKYLQFSIEIGLVCKYIL